MNIYDVAKKANVSIATVSRVLNNSEHVSEKTRKKVLEIIKREEYVPNAFARGLGLNTMQMIGVMCTDVTDTFYSTALGYIEKFLRSQGKDVVLCCTGNNLEDKKKNLSYLVSRRVDAVILIGSAFKEEKDNSHIKEAAEQIPVIIINGYIHLKNVYCVVCDEHRAMEKNVSYLAAQGKKRIAYLYDSVTYSGNQKLSGYIDGLKKCALEYDEALVVKTDREIETAKNAVIELFSDNNPPDAVLASEDILAVAALKAAIEKGRDVPVIGFNNSVVAQCSMPSLSSVDNMVEALCESAVKLIADIEAGKTVSSKTVLSAKLVERESFKRS